ncbi:MAG: branched-chain amino acid ABC transporter permease [Janthinobacterium lividum]
MLIPELLVGGILVGGLYALMSCGLNLVFGVMRVVNFAHGEFLAIGALATVSLVAGYHLPFWLALIVVPPGMAVLGLGLQVVVVRRLADAPLIMSLLATYAVSTVLVNLSILVWGGGFRGLPGVLGGSVPVLGLDVSLARLVAFGVAMAVSLGVWWMLQATRFGRAVRSVSQAPELATISGISVDQVRNATFALGSGMAGLAGVLMAPTFAADPQMGSRFLIKAFAVIIVGGMGSYPGAILAALLLGLLEVFGGYAFGQVIGSALLYIFMLLTLLVRPRGLLGLGVRV